jgi:hypothetical protein
METARVDFTSTSKQWYDPGLGRYTAWASILAWAYINHSRNGEKGESTHDLCAV